MQTMAIRTVANSLPENKVILLTLLISSRYIPYTDLPKKSLLHQIQERDTTKIKLEKGFIVEIGASEHAFLQIGCDLPRGWVLHAPDYTGTKAR